MDADLPSDDPAAKLAELQKKTVAMNEALVLGSVRQHELTETAERLNEQLELEIAARHAVARELMEKARLLDLSNDAIIVGNYNDEITLWSKAQVLRGMAITGRK
jgi:DNA-binding transcriptional regulator/RsmH inhibitor MraZ